MTFTEQQLRESMRRTTTEVPEAGDRVAQVQQRVRRHRQRTVATIAGVVALVVLAVPVTRAIADRQPRVEPAAPLSVAEQMDAAMKYASFVAWVDGAVFGAQLPAGWDLGVEGVEVSVTQPPNICAVATPAAGQPAGTQPAWVLGQGTILGTVGPVGSSAYVTTSWQWPSGVEGCTTKPRGTALLASASIQESGLAAGGLVFAAALGDRSRPALDVEAVYRAVPPERLTQHGRDVFASYQAKLPPGYGSEGYQLDQVLTILSSWIGIALTDGVAVEPSSPQTGRVVIAGDDLMGSVEIPDGFYARWDELAGTFCVEGSIGDTGVRHLDVTGFAESGGPPSIEAGPCPAG